jgi:hypothetical protein
LLNHNQFYKFDRFSFYTMLASQFFSYRAWFCNNSGFPGVLLLPFRLKGVLVVARCGWSRKLSLCTNAWVR